MVIYTFFFQGSVVRNSLELCAGFLGYSRYVSFVLLLNAWHVYPNAVLSLFQVSTFAPAANFGKATKL